MQKWVTMTDTGLPTGVRYDGPQPAPTGLLLQFTDFGQTGGTFYIPAAFSTPEAIMHRLAEMRRRFKATRKEEVAA